MNDDCVAQLVFCVYTAPYLPEEAEEPHEEDSEGSKEAEEIEKASPVPSKGKASPVPSKGGGNRHLFGRICNPAVLSKGICNPAILACALQMLIFSPVGFLRSRRVLRCRRKQFRQDGGGLSFRQNNLRLLVAEELRLLYGESDKRQHHRGDEHAKQSDSVEAMERLAAQQQGEASVEDCQQ